ncbi:MAG: hypothetical protein R3F15_18055, partial [Lysobacterales bacterium]
EHCGRGKLEVANAIEALGCWLAIHHQRAGQDPRVRGNRKLANVTHEQLAYAHVKRSGFYVSQPMRMATVQALPALGLVHASSARFNVFTCTKAGSDLVQAYSNAYRPWNSSMEAVLAEWICGDKPIRVAHTLCKALAPTEPLPGEAIGQLQECLQRGGEAESAEDTARRRNLLAWAEARRIGKVDDLDWGQRPHVITSKPHWHDLESGARFFIARDSALELLTFLECLMPADGVLRVDATLCTQARGALASLRRAAHAFLELGHTEPLAVAFCRECTAAGDAEVLRTLVARDGLVLRLRGDDIVAGSAYVAHSSPLSADAPSAESESAEPIGWPAGISHRVVNLFRLNLDMHGELSTSFADVATEEATE